MSETHTPVAVAMLSPEELRQESAALVNAIVAAIKLRPTDPALDPPETIASRAIVIAYRRGILAGMNHANANWQICIETMLGKLPPSDTPSDEQLERELAAIAKEK